MTGTSLKISDMVDNSTNTALRFTYHYLPHTSTIFTTSSPSTIPHFKKNSIRLQTDGNLGLRKARKKESELLSMKNAADQRISGSADQKHIIWISKAGSTLSPEFCVDSRQTQTRRNGRDVIASQSMDDRAQREASHELISRVSGKLTSLEQRSTSFLAFQMCKTS